MAVKCPKCRADNTDMQRFCGDCGTQLQVSEEAPSITKTLETPKEEMARGTLFAKRYEIIEELGKGGMGRVYRAYDKQLEEEVAIKLLRSDIAADKKTLDRFKNEIKLARKIIHRNVCRMHDLHEEKETKFVTMEYVAGEDLKSQLRRMGQVPVGKAVDIAHQIAEGLSEAHRLGVIHRDLKPHNIMIDKEGNARIMDFGIARSVGGRELTGEGVIIGTPDYMSPEQAEGKEADARSDIYSLGVILYEMVTGHVPFEGETAFSVTMKHKTETPLPPKKLNGQIPNDLDRLILCCLEKAPEQRYQTAEEFLSDLVRIEEGLPSPQRVVPKRKPTVSREITVKFQPKKLVIPALIIGVIVITAIFLLQLFPEKSFEPPPKIENSIAVVSFRNDTGDEANDSLCHRNIPNWLLANLENSGLFRVMTWERMTDVLKQMGKKDVEFIDSDLGYELCRREGIAYICSGSLARSGEIFVSDIKIFDAESKELIKPIQSKGEGANSIIQTQIDELSRGICEAMGVTLEEIPEGRLNIAGVTTSSMQAYQHYLDAKDFFGKFEFAKAKSSIEKAIQLDPSFASAYSLLATINANLFDDEARWEAINKAMEFSSHASEKERLYIESKYAHYKRNYEKKVALLEEIIRKYPKEKQAYQYLGDFFIRNRTKMQDKKRGIKEIEMALEIDPDYALPYLTLGIFEFHEGNFEKSFEHLNKHASLAPKNGNAYDTIGELYFKWGKLGKAVSSRKKAVKILPDLYQIYWALAYTEALRENYKEALNWLDRQLERDSPPRRKTNTYIFKGFLDLWLGRFEESLLDFQKAAEIAKSEWSLYYWRPIVLVEKGDYETGREIFKKRFEGHLKRFPDLVNSNKLVTAFNLGWIDLKMENLESVRTRLEEMKSLLQSEATKAIWLRSPDREEYHKYLYDVLQCEIELSEERADVEYIIKTFTEDWGLYLDEPRSLWDIGYVIRWWNHPPFVRDYIPRAYVQIGELDKAIEAYERLVTFDPESIDRRLIHPLNYYRLGKVYEQEGNKRKAKANYRKFLDLWKDADPGIAEVEDAKKRLAAL